MHFERTTSWSRLLACVPTRHRKTRVRKSCATLLGKSPAAHRFLTLFKTPLDKFVGNILEVFKAPKAEGVDFEFATGKRTEFLNLVDPSTIIGNIGPFTFGSAAKGPMVPDDPGPSQPDRVWRRLASAVSAGISYREPGLKSSLHIAIRKDGANVHRGPRGIRHLDERQNHLRPETGDQPPEHRSRLGLRPRSGLELDREGRYRSNQLSGQPGPLAGSQPARDDGPRRYRGGTRPRASWA